MRTLIISLCLLLTALSGFAQEQEAQEREKDRFDKMREQAEAKGIFKDSLWYEGHRYRQYIFDQNYIDDENSNLDPKIEFIADGKVRFHPDKVYFYDDLARVAFLAKETKMPIACHVFDHDCGDCLFELPRRYFRPEIVEASKDFINVYVALPEKHAEAARHHVMNNSLSVQFFTPGFRRLRVLSQPDDETLVAVYGQMLEAMRNMSEEELMMPRRSAKNKGRLKTDDQGWAR